MALTRQTLYNICFACKGLLYIAAFEGHSQILKASCSTHYQQTDTVMVAES